MKIEKAYPEAYRLAKRFHNLYEEYAPKFGYKTREDTKEFIPDSPNGRLMAFVCCEFLKEEINKIELRKLNKIKYPKLSFKERLNSKLSEKDIKEIQLRRKAGETQYSIAKSFGITHAAVQYWLKTREERLERSKEAYQKELSKGTFQTAKYKRQSRERGIRRRKNPKYKKYKVIESKKRRITKRLNKGRIINI
jgi:hypothetical protein